MNKLIRGSISQSSSCFLREWRGMQCTIIDFTALAFAFRNFTNVLNENFVNDVIFAGHEAYRTFLMDLGENRARLVGHHEIPNTINFQTENMFVRQTLFENHFGMFMLSDEQRINFGMISLEDALSTFFDYDGNALFTAGSVTIALFHYDNSFVIFDSHADQYGVASLRFFDSREDMLLFLRKSYSSQAQFEISYFHLELNSDDIAINDHNFEDLTVHDNFDCTTDEILIDNNFLMTEPPSKKRHRDRPTVNQSYEFSYDQSVSQQQHDNSNEMFERERRIEATINSVINNVISFENSALRKSIVNSELFQNHKDKLFMQDLQQFEASINQVPSLICTSCERFLYSDEAKFFEPNNKNERLSAMIGLIPHESILCQQCKSSINKGTYPCKCKLNNLKLADIPECLQSLNLVEKRFICKVQTYLTLLTLRGGQYAQRGLAIHFCHDLAESIKILPASDENVRILCSVGNLKDYVRPLKIKDALIWLKANNKLYMDIPVNLIENNSLDETTICNFDETGTIPTDYYPFQHADLCVDFPKSRGFPLSYSDEISIEALSFPWLFPDGRGYHKDQRSCKISLLDYYHQKLYNKDNRFRRDIPYLIVSVNHAERETLQNVAGIFTKILKPIEIPGVREGFEHVTARDVKNLQNFLDSSQTKSLIDNFMFMKKIRGTSAYWKDQLWQLFAILRTIGPPDIFLTLSADDLHWPDLKKLLAHDINKPLDETNISEEMKANPFMTSLHFVRRWKKFLKFILKGKSKPLGKIQDYWCRIEFQNRGSPHLHIFLWIEGAPSIFRGDSAETVKKFIDSIISTEIPSTSDPELKELVIRLQTHKHTETCRKKRSIGCRFNFPRKPCKETFVRSNTEFLANKNHKFYETKRSKDAININPYNPMILRAFKSNLGIQIVSGAVGLANYVCEYICKAEPEELRKALMDTVLDMQQSATDMPTKTKMIKLGMIILKTRQMSAQEAAFRIGHLPFIFSSRDVLLLNAGFPQNRYRRLKNFNDVEALEDDSTEVFQNGIIEHYQNRPDLLNDLSLFEFASWFAVRQSTASTKCQEYLLKTGKQYVCKRQHQICLRLRRLGVCSEEYYYSIMLLHIPFRNEVEIVEGYQNSFDAFLNKVHRIKLNEIYLGNLYQTFIDEIKEASERLAALKATEVFEKNFEKYPILEIDSTIFNELSTENCESNCRGENNFLSHLLENNYCLNENFQSEFERLTNDQKFAFAYIKDILHSGKTLRLFLTGEAGTGKSHLLKLLITWLRLTLADFSGHDCAAVTGPTGVASNNICGATVHSVLKLPVQHNFLPTYTELSANALKICRNYFKSKKVFILDEISMISAATLDYINRRLQSIFMNDNPFGGMHVILCGDFYQLRPIRSSFAFTNSQLWSLFQPIYLTENVRQSSDLAYANLLRRARVGALTRADIELLSSRCFPSAEIDFDCERLHLYPTLKRVREFNENIEANFQRHTYEIIAADIFAVSDIQSGSTVPHQMIPKDDRKAGGYPRSLSVGIGTRVMLLKNILTSDGLVNGALGYITGFEFNSDSEDVNGVYVKFDNVNVGKFIKNPGSESILIEKATADYAYRGRYMTRYQFPLCVSWAASIHKGQGLTFSKIVTSVNKDIFTAGQAYVALSRVQSLDGLFLDGPLCPSRIYADDDVIVADLDMRAQYNQLREKWIKYKE